MTSVLRQLRPGDELIVVDDGSTDNTIHALEKFKDSIKYIHIQNSGAGAARNEGLRHANGELIAFLDSDDEWMDNKTELQRNLFERRPDIFYAFSNMSITRKSGEVVKSFLIHWHNDKRKWDEIIGRGQKYSSLYPLPQNCPDFMVYQGDLYKELASAPYIFTSSLMTRRAGAGEKWYFDEELTIYEDWCCYGRIAGLGKGAYLDVDLAWQHGHDGARLTNCAKSVEKFDSRLTALMKVWGEDEKFLEKHKNYFNKIVRNVQLMSVIETIKIGNEKEARAKIDKMIREGVINIRALMFLPLQAVRLICSLMLKLT